MTGDSDNMEFILESHDMQDYLKPDKYIDFHADVIKQKAGELFDTLTDETAKIKAAFEFVRDDIHHSGDIDSERVTKSASEALIYGEGICIAKALLLAALLRCGGIPTGLCYQRLTWGDTPDTGYVVHGLNAVYLSGEKKWIRLDARGNKKNVDAQFSTGEERLAFPVRTEYDEVDYPTIYANPHPRVMEALERYINRREYSYDITEL
jgi:transglutaminase-like putative cysteine protease